MKGIDIDLKGRRPSDEGMALTPTQLIAARALVDWTREDLAKKSGTSRETIKAFERGGSDPKMGTVSKWLRALEAAGVEFIEDRARSDDGGPGVRLKTTESRRR